jgi:hypothetical protein
MSRILQFLRQPSADYSPLNDGEIRRTKSTPSFALDSHSAPLTPPFSGIWSMRFPNSIAPLPRTAPFYCHDPPSRRIFMGCGLDSNQSLLSDIWIFDTDTEMWSKMQPTGISISPRSGSRAILHQNQLLIFGGYGRTGYLSDLYSLNIETSEVTEIDSSGEVPAGRTSPLIVIFENSLYCWGGFNGDFPTELSVLDLETRVWRKYPQKVIGGIPAIGGVYGGRYFSYGGSKSGKMLVLNFENKTVEFCETKGAEPPSTVIGAGLILIEKYLFFFGGKAPSQWGLWYACDLERMWWFVFHVMPDEMTVRYGDGKIDSVGLFMLPRMHSFCMVYVEERREIVWFMGAPVRDPPPLYVIGIGKALSAIHMREDMMMFAK